MKNRNWFWGAFFLVSAIFVIATQMGSFAEIGFFSIVATVLLVALFIKSLFDLNFFGIFVPASLLYVIYQKPLYLMSFSPWMLILAAVLTSIGFSIIFKKHPIKPIKCHHEFEHITENIDDNNPYVKVNFGSSSRYLHSDSLQTGQFVASFGELEIYFDQVQLTPEGADIYLDCNLGSIKLYVPKHWAIIDKINASLGSVKMDKRFSKPVEDPPRLTINGSVQLGEVEIKFI